MKSGTALRAVGAGWLRTKVVESGLPAGRDREVLNSGLLLAFSEIEVRDRVQLVARCGAQRGEHPRSLTSRVQNRGVVVLGAQLAPHSAVKDAHGASEAACIYDGIFLW